jgi:hypothetical protein
MNQEIQHGTSHRHQHTDDTTQSFTAAPPTGESKQGPTTQEGASEILTAPTCMLPYYLYFSSKL